MGKQEQGTVAAEDQGINHSLLPRPDFPGIFSQTNPAFPCLILTLVLTGSQEPTNKSPRRRNMHNPNQMRRRERKLQNKLNRSTGKNYPISFSSFSPEESSRNFSPIRLIQHNLPACTTHLDCAISGERLLQSGGSVPG